MTATINQGLEKLVDNDDYNKIIKLVKKDPKLLHSKIGNIKLLSILLRKNNNITIDYFFKQPNLILKRFRGIIPFHQIYIDNKSNDECLVKTKISRFIKENPSSIFKTNYSGLNFIDIVSINYDIEIMKIIFSIHGKLIKIDINRLNNGYTYLTRSLRSYIDLKLKNISCNLDMITFLLENGADPNIPQEDNSLLLVFAANFEDLSLIKLLVKYGADINYKRFYYYCFYKGSRKKKISYIRYLFNYEESKYTPSCLDLDFAIYFNDNSTARYLLEYLSNNEIKNFCNHLYETLLITAIKYKIDMELIMILTQICDINHKDIFNNTAMHYLLEKYDYTTFSEIIRKKAINIFTPNKSNVRAIDLVPKYKLPYFIDLFIEGYLREYNIKDENTKCLRDIRKIVFKNSDIRLDEKCFKNIQATKETNKQFKLPMYTTVNKTQYHNPFIYTFIFYYNIIKKNKKIVCIPFIGHFPDIFKNNEILFDTSATITENSNSELFIYRHTYFKSTVRNYLPFLIMWKSKDVNYFYKDFDFYFLKAMAQSARYIAYHLSIEYGERQLHANVVIYDKDTRTLERFDPNGITTENNHGNLFKDLDIELCSRFTTVLEKYYDMKINLKYVTLGPPIQTIGGEESDVYNNDKYNDPGGFCLSLCLWYLENRILYPELSMDEFIKKSISYINTDKRTTEANLSNYIRNYSQKIYDNCLDIFAISGVGISKAGSSLADIDLIFDIVNNLY